MKVYLLAGEKSGDVLGAGLMKELSQQRDCVFRGRGGFEMCSQDGSVADWIFSSAKMGFFGLRDFFSWKKKLQKVVSEIEEFSPDVVVFIDFPGFNMVVSEELKKRDVKSKQVQYVSPKVWASRERRVEKMRKNLDAVLCLFPFEESFLARRGVRAIFVGHPIADIYEKEKDLEHRDSSLIGLFPGSRSSEILENFPVMLEVVSRFWISHREENWRFEVASASREAASLLCEIAQNFPHPLPENLLIGSENNYSLMRRSLFGMITSGTASLEASFFRCPHFLMYRGLRFLLPLLLFLRVIRIHPQVGKQNFIGLLNILGKREITPEYYGRKSNASCLLPVLEEWIASEKKREQWRIEAIQITSQFPKEVQKHVAQEIFRVLEK